MSEKRRLKKQILLRLPDSIYASIIKESRAKNVSGATICRDVLVEKFGLNESEIVPIKWKKPPTPMQPNDVIELVKLRENLAEMCGALVQFSIKSRETNNIKTHNEIEKMLPDIRKTTLEIDKLKKKIQGK